MYCFFYCAQTSLKVSSFLCFSMLISVDCCSTRTLSSATVAARLELSSSPFSVVTTTFASWLDVHAVSSGLSEITAFGESFRFVDMASHWSGGFCKLAYKSARPQPAKVSSNAHLLVLFSALLF